MILLKLGINTMYLTISELNTINNPIYTIIIKDETTKEEKSITILDTSIYAVRYNKYYITLVDNISLQNLAAGIVYLNEGLHTYKVITTNPIVPFNVVICEVGIVKVLKASISPGTSYTDYIPEQEYTSYTGNVSQDI